METWLPNYYTEAEKNNSWWQNAFTANFIGDHFLKNTGFMVGALFSGIATSGVLSKAMKLEQSRNIFKNMASAAGMNNKNAIIHKNKIDKLHKEKINIKKKQFDI